MIDAFITALKPNIITIIGFLVTYVSMKKSFENELKRSRDSIALEKMSTMPFEVLQLIKELMGQRKEDAEKIKGEKAEPNKHLDEILNTIYAYGSENAIKIATLMMKESYAYNGNVDKTKEYRLISIVALLATQIKYDVTGIPISPEFWLKMRFIDYSKERFKAANNELVTELGLRKDFKIT